MIRLSPPQCLLPALALTEMQVSSSLQVYTLKVGSGRCIRQTLPNNTIPIEMCTFIWWTIIKQNYEIEICIRQTILYKEVHNANFTKQYYTNWDVYIYSVNNTKQLRSTLGKQRRTIWSKGEKYVQKANNAYHTTTIIYETVPNGWVGGA